MSAFVDTSAFYALLVSTDDAHHPVRVAVERLLDQRRPLWTTSFVIVETMALLQHRVGVAAARDFDEDVLPTVHIQWVDERLYRRGADRLRREDRRRLSLVDCVSFECMLEQGLTTALTVDEHFAEAGFTVVPSAGTQP